jgi:TP901 family phage tail tape measure protein
MAVVGIAEILIEPNAVGFEEKMRAQTAGAFAATEEQAALAGSSAGGALAGGVTTETKRLEADLAASGARGGTNFTHGFSKGISGFGGMLAQSGIPGVTGFGTALQRSGAHIDETGRKVGGLNKQLATLGGGVLVGVAASAALVGAEGVRMAMKMQTAQVTIQNAMHTTQAQAKAIGDEFLRTGGKVEFSGQQIATAFGAAAGQFQSAEGHTLSTAQAMDVMNASMDLAVAKQIDLGTATNTVATMMQTFGLRTTDASKVADVLFNVSTHTGLGVDSLAMAMARMHGRLGEATPSLQELSGLMLDLVNHGIPASVAVRGLAPAFTSLLKPTADYLKAQQAVAIAHRQMPPELARIATAVASGTLTTKQQDAMTKGLTVSQKAQIATLKTAEKGIESARLKMQELGVATLDLRTGKMLPLSRIIEELHHRIGNVGVGLAAARLSAMGLGAGANMLAPIVVAGSTALDKATAAATRNGSAAQASARQMHTLRGELHVLGAEASNFLTVVGEHLIPVLVKAGHIFFNVTNYVMTHKAALVALGVVVTAVFGTLIGVWAVNKMIAFGQSFNAARTAVMGLIEKLPFFGTTEAAANEEAVASAEEASVAIQEAWAAVAATQQEQIAGLDAMVAANATTAGEMVTDWQLAAAEIEAAYGRIGLAADASAAQVGVAAGEAEAAMTTEAATAATTGAATGMGMGMGGGMLGKAAMVVGAGVGAYMGTSMLLHHTPLGGAVMAVADPFARLFGAIGSTGVNWNNIPPKVKEWINAHGGVKAVEAHARAIEEAHNRTLQQQREAQKRQADVLVRLSNVLTGQDVLPRDVRIVQGEGFGKDIGTMAGMQIGSILQRYLMDIQQTHGRVSAADVGSLIRTLHIHDAKASANDIVREMSWAVRTGHVHRRPIGARPR